MSGYIALSWLDLVAASVFIVLNAAFSIMLSLRLERQLLIASLRMVVQLLLIGLVLKTVFAVASPWLTLAVCLTLSVAMFVPLRFVHPVRTRRWRPLTLAVTVLWMLLALAAAWGEFGLRPLWSTLFALASLYLLCAGAVQQALNPRG